MLKISLKAGIATTPYYEASRFPGGEIFFKMSDTLCAELLKEDTVQLRWSCHSSDEFMLLVMAVETLKEFKPLLIIYVVVTYLPYQQADAKFRVGENFGLKYIANILNSLPVDMYYIFDPHSAVANAIIHKSIVVDNRDLVSRALMDIFTSYTKQESFEKYCKETMCLLSPDAGAFKKIFKLSEVINFQGQIENANKSRDPETHSVTIRLSCNDFHGKDIVIVDDICLAGGTFIKLAEEIIKRNVRKLFCIFSHGVFKNEKQESALPKLEKYFETIYVSNSLQDSYDSKKVKIINII